MARQTHLWRRGATYYYRRRVPKALVASLGITEWVSSLATKEADEAKRRCRAEDVRIDGVINLAQRSATAVWSPSLSEADAVVLAQTWLREQLLADSAGRARAGTRFFNEQLAWATAKQEAYEVALARFRLGEVRDLGEQLMREAGLTYSPESESHVVLGQELLKARVEHLRAVQNRNEAKWVEPPEVRRLRATPRRDVALLISSYRSDRAAKYGQASTDRKYSHIFRVLEEAVGSEKAIAEITREDCRAVRDTLAKLPSNMTKKFPGLTLQEAIKAADIKMSSRLSHGTLKSYVNNLSALMNWAMKEDWITRNPAEGLLGLAKPAVRRRGFETTELHTLFRALASERKSRPERFWIPAIALYTGARAGEICQLRHSDVMLDAEIPYFAFSGFDARGRADPEKRVKNIASDRKVPIHSSLATAGFQSIIHPASEDRIFLNLRWREGAGFSHDFSKWFGRFLNGIGLTDPSLVLHGFRHGFKDAARRAKLNAEISDALGGWATQGVATRYGDRSDLKLLSDAMRQISYPGFSLEPYGLL